mgnify:CR=1 FL=1
MVEGTGRSSARELAQPCVAAVHDLGENFSVAPALPLGDGERMIATLDDVHLPGAGERWQAGAQKVEA